MTYHHAPAYTVRIYVAGSLEVAKHSLKRQCFEDHRCVFVEAGSYVYTGGVEEGVCVTLVNYPRYPADPDSIWERAKTMAVSLITDLHEWSALVVAPDRSVWMNRRPPEEAK